MTRKIVALLAAAAALLLFLPAAHAVPPPDNIGTPINCHEKAGIEAGDNGEYRLKICSTFHWRPQNDGSGVFLEAVNIWVADGCSDLESGTPIGGLFVSIGESDGTSQESTSVSSMNDCSAYRDLELRGQDVGESRAYISMDVNVDQASDHAATHFCKIRPSNPDDCWTWHN